MPTLLRRPLPFRNSTILGTAGLFCLYTRSLLHVKVSFDTSEQIGHGRNLAYRAQLWCQNVGEHFELLRAGERGHDVRMQVCQ